MFQAEENNYAVTTLAKFGRSSDWDVAHDFGISLLQNR